MDVVIADAVRTPFAPRGGSLRGWHPVDLAAETLRALQDRLNLDPQQIDQLYFGCSTTIGEQAYNVARNAALAASWPETLSGVTFEGDGSVGQLALHAAIAAVASGAADVCIAGGVESTSRVPHGATITAGLGKPFGPAVHERYADSGGLVPPGLVAQRLADRYGFKRTALDAYAIESIDLAQKTQQTLGQKAETVAVVLRGESGRDTAESLATDIAIEAGDPLTSKPMFEIDSPITSANFASHADGAAAIVVASEAWCKAQRVQPLARIRAMGSLGSSLLDGDSGYTLAQSTLGRAGVEMGQLQRVEIHEDSAATPLAFVADSKLGRESVNPQGGALHYGSAAGAAGIRLAVTTAHGLSGPGALGLALVAGSTSIAAATLLEGL